MQEITISQLAKHTGLSSSTLRYYENQGLIQAIGHHGLQRVFHHTVFMQLKLIGFAKKAGFNLQEIKIMLQNKQNPINKEKLASKADEIDQMIVELDILGRTLRHVANCPHDNLIDCEKFQAILNSIK
ncbi:helix-turn-helix domain-containing protein [Acinetobacter puyangensis]|uniref:DNA-binding transcriptional regulator, MerR family n=1 Tax=Acinetobacter puyangensis TaxID=1096779 RepID=A0A240E9X7_9GAMM|nr:MerR family transcriptional regulator [Acinetobacter puyangensis]SNX44725.1 DNA-binding transcriptional regulator, MerR family [Acinetobacter puyangensis]